MNTENKQSIRTAVRTLYDMQKIRIQNGNRISAAFRHKLGLNSSDAEDSIDEAHNILNELRQEYKRITDGISRITTKFKSDSKLITSYGELMMIKAYDEALSAENTHEKFINYALDFEPIYTEFLEKVRGCGPLMAAVIISEIDITKCNSISALHKYAGLDVVVSENENGEAVEEGRSKKKNHLVPKTYTSSKGETINTMGITYNPFLKTKLVGVLADNFIKLGGEYSDIYRGYKFRLQNHPKHKDKTKMHIHKMAKRYMIKFFLEDLWKKWRALEGLEVRNSYAEDKLGIKHSKVA